LNTKDDFLTAQTGELDYNQISGVFWTFRTFEMQKNTSYLSLRTVILIT